MKEDYVASGEEIPLAPSRKQYTGTFNVRIDKRIHRDLAVEAAQAGVMVSQKLAQSVKHI